MRTIEPVRVAWSWVVVIALAACGRIGFAPTTTELDAPTT